MRLRIAIIVGLSLGALVGVERSAHVEEAAETPSGVVCPICHIANNPDAPYPEKASRTFLRGLINTAFGWTELLTKPTEEVNAGGNLLTGIGKGANNAVRRTAEGLGELFVFWVPKGTRGYPKLAEDCPVCMGQVKKEVNEQAGRQANKTEAAASSE